LGFTALDLFDDPGRRIQVGGRTPHAMDEHLDRLALSGLRA
jgi:hypothetical protein